MIIDSYEGTGIIDRGKLSIRKVNPSSLNSIRSQNGIMMCSSNIENIFRKIASYTPKDIGFLEEDVKIKVVVPILQCLGYMLTDLSFEHCGIDISIKNLPKGCGLIVEIKKLGESLEKHIVQLKRYIEQAEALLGIITNGDEFWIFACSVETPLCKIQRKDLTKKENIETLQHLLSKEVLATEEKALINIHQEFERIAENLEHKLKLAKAMMQAIKFKNSKEIEELTSQARKAGVNLYLDLEEMEGLLKSWAKLNEKIKKATERLKSQIK